MQVHAYKIAMIQVWAMGVVQFSRDSINTIVYTTVVGIFHGTKDTEFVFMRLLQSFNYGMKKIFVIDNSTYNGILCFLYTLISWAYVVFSRKDNYTLSFVSRCISKNPMQKIL